MPEAAAGAAAALERAGWELRFDRAYEAAPGPVSGASWAELRTSIYPHHPAIVGLLASDLTAREIALLRVEDVATDASVVHHDGDPHQVPPGARPYVMAQRHLADTEGAPFITLRSNLLPSQEPS